MLKKICTITGFVVMIVLLTACGKSDKNNNKDIQLPVSSQKATSLIQDKNATGPDEDYSQEEINAIANNEYFTHLQNDDGTYANVLKYSYLKNLLYQELQTAQGKPMKIGEMIKEPSKPTLFMITRSNCPYCQEVVKELTTKYNQDDFNLILGEGHISEKQDIAEDVQGVNEEYAAIGNNRLAKYYLYGADELMDQLHAVCYPTLIYLDSNGYIINVSGDLSYDEIKDIFTTTLGASSEKNAQESGQEKQEDQSGEKTD